MKTGVNLGGWLSQFREYDPQHFKTFITADDIQRVTNWGFDHVRLPIDYPMLEDDARPGVYKEDGFSLMATQLIFCLFNNGAYFFYPGKNGRKADKMGLRFRGYNGCQSCLSGARRSP